jgi:hypothetical protein
VLGWGMDTSPDSLPFILSSISLFLICNWLWEWNSTGKMTLQKTLLDQGWHFRQSTTLANSTATSFLPCAQFPTVAHIDLLHHKLIPDPYIDTNEL